MIFVKQHILSFVSLLIWLDSCYPCQRVTLSPFPPLRQPFSSIHVPPCVSPSNSSPQLPLYPVPQTHQSVGHSTKDDKGPEGIKRWSRVSSKKTKERESGEKPSFSRETVSLLSKPLGPRELLNDKKTDGKLVNGWMNKQKNDAKRGQTDTEEKRRVLSVASLLFLCLPQETYLSADYTCTVIYIYIYIY